MDEHVQWYVEPRVDETGWVDRSSDARLTNA